MKKLVYLSILLVLVLGTFTVSAQAPEKPVPPKPDRISAAAPSKGVENIGGSYSVFAPEVGGDAVFLPGATQTFCFKSETFTNDWAYAYYDWEQFPPDWQILNAWVLTSPAPVCAYGGTWGTFTYTLLAPNHIQIYHPRYMANPTDDCVAYYCMEVISGTGNPNALIDWGFDGDDYGSAPYHPCSIGTYVPPNSAGACDERIYPPKEIPGPNDPFYLTPPEIEADGCCCQWQDHLLTLVNTQDYDMDIQLTYNILQGVGEVNGPEVIHVPAGSSISFPVSVHPFCDPENMFVVQIVAFDPLSGWTDISYIIKHLVEGWWDPAWQLEPIANAVPQQWGQCAVYQGQAWVEGGLDTAGGVQANLQQFDPGTGTWYQRAPQIRAVFGAVMGWIGGKLYMAGGGDAGFVGYPDLQIYDPGTDTWTLGTPMPAARLGGYGGVAPCFDAPGQECLYYMGGTPDGYFTDFSFLAWEYNPATGAWTQPAPVPGNPANYGQALGGGTVCEGKVYFGGDYRGIADFFAYDPATNTWAQLASIPATAGKMTVAMACKPEEDAVFLIGGDSLGYWGDLYNQKVFKYGIDDNTWTQMPQLLNVGMLGSCAWWIGPKLYTFGGTHGSYAITPAPFESLTEHDCAPCITCQKHLYRTKINWAPASKPGWIKIVFLGIVHDQDHVVNPGATVYGVLTMPNGTQVPLSGVTDAMGRFKLRWKGPTMPGVWTIQVTNIVEAGCTYDPAANHMPQGDPLRYVTIP